MVSYILLTAGCLTRFYHLTAPTKRCTSVWDCSQKTCETARETAYSCLTFLSTDCDATSFAGIMEDTGYKVAFILSLLSIVLHMGLCVAVIWECMHRGRRQAWWNWASFCLFLFGKITLAIAFVLGAFPSTEEHDTPRLLVAPTYYLNIYLLVLFVAGSLWDVVEIWKLLWHKDDNYRSPPDRALLHNLI